MNKKKEMSFGGFFSDDEENEYEGLNDFDNDEHWFVDANDDEELQEMFREKHFRQYGIKVKKRVGKLNCPGCFVTLCDDFQKHEFYHDQYRAMFVTKYCAFNEEENREIEGHGEDNEIKNYKVVRCLKCEAEVGAYDPIEEIYYFFEVFSGR